MIAIGILLSPLERTTLSMSRGHSATGVDGQKAGEVGAKTKNVGHFTASIDRWVERPNEIERARERESRERMIEGEKQRGDLE